MLCAMLGCDSSNTHTKYDKSGNKISFHSFPKDSEFCKSWVRLCHRADKFSIKSARVCSKHFKENDFFPINPVFEQYGIKRIKHVKPNAIPSLFLPSDVTSPSSRRHHKRPRQSSSTVTKLVDDQSLTNPLPFPMNIEATSTSMLFCKGLSGMKYAIKQEPGTENVEPSVTIKDEQDTYILPGPVPFSQINSSTQTDEIIIKKNLDRFEEPKGKTTFHFDSSTQTDPVFPSRAQLQNEIIKLKKQCFRRDKKVDSLCRIFTNGQLKKLVYPEKRIVWSGDDISNALAIYDAGPKAYEVLLKKNYPLPALITVRKWKNDVSKLIRENEIKTKAKIAK